MPTITLPNGKNLNFSKEVTGLEVAEKISKSLAKQALIMSVDGELKDLYFSIERDSSVKIFTAKDKEGLEVIRHDAADPVNPDMYLIFVIFVINIPSVFFSAKLFLKFSCLFS